MRFDVFNRDTIEKYNTNEKHIVISISDIDCDKANLPKLESRIDAMFLKFSDFDRITEGMNKEYKESLFNKRLAEAVWKFVDKYKDDINLIIVNCEAGISRSSAVAAAISKILNGNDDDFFKYFLPNRLVYRKMIEVKS